VTVDAPTRNWWEACTLGNFDLTRFDLVPRTGGSTVASAVFRSLEPSGTTAVGRAVGLIGLSVAQEYRRHGLAVFLLSEALRQFLRQGIVHVEVQARQSDVVVLKILQKLGFRPVDQGGVWRKE
jgi:ribosomal protein S18 acetylase RimI-like enzyme